MPVLAGSERRRLAIRARMAQRWAVPSGLAGLPA
jgi:hypothetical protein